MSKNHPPAEPSKEPHQLMVRVTGADGQEVLMPYQVLEEKLIPALLEQAWNNPDVLAHILENVVPHLAPHRLMRAGLRLFETDPIRNRGVRIWASILIRAQQADLAETVLVEHLSGDTASSRQTDLLALLGTIYLQRNQQKLGQDYLWRALQVDPNYDFAIEAFCRESGGDLLTERLQRIATLPGAWRAQTLYWGQLLEKGNVEKVTEDAQRVLRECVKPIPQQLLLQLSGDLGNWGHLPELLTVCAPYYDPTVYDIRMGSNLLKANLDLGQVEAAQVLLDKLYAFGKEEWRETLDFWELEVAKLKLETEDAADGLTLEVRQSSSPLWKVNLPSYHHLFPDPHKQIRVGCIGGSAALGGTDRTEYQLSEIRGILSRSIPLFLAEQLQLRTAADAEIMYLTANGTFLLSGQPLDTEEISHFARQRNEPYDYLLATHLEATKEPWQLQVRVIRTIDAEIVGKFTHPVLPSPPGALTSLISKLLQQVCRELEMELRPLPPPYQELSGDELIAHLIHLEQLLALQLDFSRQQQKQEPHVHGHRHILEGMLEFCRHSPENLVARLILLESVSLVKKLRPAVGRQFFQPCLDLSEAHPINDPHGAKLVQELFQD
jgi:tetratricopeptide (TPR) repeat protein